MLKLHNSTDGLDSLISFSNPGGTLARIQGIDNGGLALETGNNAGGINSNAILIDNSGNVGIGANSPAEKLHVSGGNIRLDSTVAGGNGILMIYDSNTTQSGQIYGSSGDLKIYSPADVLFNQGGNVGIGTTSPTSGKLEVQQTATTAALWVQTGGTTSSHTIADFRTGTNASALSIKGNSKVTINDKPNSGLGYAVLIDIGTGANGQVGYQTLSQLNTNLAGASDIRFKKNIEIIPNAIEKIKTINGYTFDWDSENEDYNYSEKEGKDAGIIAQEIQKVLPEIVQIATVDRDEEGKSTSGKNYLSVDYKKIIPLLIQGIKEQETSIQELKAEIEILKNK